MRLAELQSAYLIGIGGIGMSAIARYLNYNGVHVKGYDKVQSPLTEALQEEGIEIFFSENLQRIDPNVDVVIYTPAIPKEHEELAFYKANHNNVMKRSMALGIITSQGKCIAIAGSHGKSTTAAMVTHLLRASNIDCTAFVGAVMSNYNVNFLPGKNNLFVVEADEYDRSFLELNPDYAIITAVDSDHLDVYGSIEEVEKGFSAFAKRIKPHGKIIIQAEQTIVNQLPKESTITYNVAGNANIWAENLVVIDSGYSFSMMGEKGEHHNLFLPMGGTYNVENALAAICVALEIGATIEHIRGGLASFKGLKRRFEKVLENESVLFIDDYAHHPHELKSLLKGIAEVYPNRNITAVFQPHLFTRTRDYAVEFAESLENVEQIILLDIYPAREKPIEGVNSALVLNNIKNSNKKLMSKSEFIDFVTENNELDILVTIGAGDIDRLVPKAVEILKSKEMADEKD